LFESSSLETAGVHEQQLRGRFGDAVYYRGTKPVFDEPLTLLAFSNRSGSNLLANHLRTTPCFAGFHEQLNSQTMLRQADANTVDTVPDYFLKMRERYGKTCQIYGYKASWDQIMMLMRFGIDRMFNGVRVIHITRADVLKQAISYHIALQTKQWTSAQAASDIVPTYDQKQITSILEGCLTAEMLVRQICATFQFPRLDVRYDAVVRSPEKVVKRIAQFTDADLGNWTAKEPPIKKQAGKINQQFHDRYVGELRDNLLG